MGKVKIVGYAKKEVYQNGIEYRNFSPDLVGNQFASNVGTPIFTSGNFNITTNLDPKVDKEFVTNKFSDFLTLTTLNVDSVTQTLMGKYTKLAKLNLDYTDVTNYAYFGSLTEYIRVSLENIIINWPASLYIKIIDDTDPSLSGFTVESYTFNSLANTSTFNVNTARIENNFFINYLSGGTIIGTFSETNDLRNLVINYLSYEVSNSYGDFPIVNLIGASGDTNSYITVTVTGNAFPNYPSENINYHIRPNSVKRELFFNGLNDFENNLLSRLSIPIYTSSFKTFSESENGIEIENVQNLTWPVIDGYNIDFKTQSYLSYVENLLEIAEVNDSFKTNLMVRFLVSKSISEFDTLPDVDNVYAGSNGQKMTNMLRIYGREFDEIKKYSNALSFANVVTYDKKNNTPDVILKNLARVLGWELTSAISEIDIITNLLSLRPNNYDGYSRGLTQNEAEIELWRRLILNTPWIWKSKGTRKAIEFLFKFIGTPDGLVTFNEYVYVADKKVDVDLVTEMMDYFNNTTDISTLNVDSEGYPKILPNTIDMYFQKAGLWYRQTGGPTPDIDILKGNNPHIGPYDGGQAYINQFTNCLVPNFTGGTSNEEIDIEANINLFTNYNRGTFDECCNSNLLVKVNTNQDFQTLLDSTITQFIAENPVTETGCTVNSSWELVAYLTGETFYSNVFFTGATAPTENDYVNEIYNLSGTTELSGATFSYDSDTSVLSVIVNDETCTSNLLDTYFKLEVFLTTDFNCIDEGTSGLTSFTISTLVTDACNATTAYPLNRVVYHNGAGALPTTGDTVYSDALGVNELYLPEFAQAFMGDDFTDVNNWLQTDINGVRVEIVCPVVTCNVEVGIELGLDTGLKSFFIDGLTEARNAVIVFSINGTITKNTPKASLLVQFTNHSFTLDEANRIYVLNTQLSPNSFNNYDFFTRPILLTNGTVSCNIKMEVTYIDGECINGTNSRTIALTTTNLL